MLEGLVSDNRALLGGITLSEVIGEKITFKREGKVYKGVIEKLLNNSAVVSITQKTADELRLSTNLTVVKFKNFIEGPKIKPGKRV